MKNRRRKLSIAAFLLLALICFLAWSWHFKPKWDLANYRRQLIASGEKLSITEVAPLPTPSEENSVSIFNKAMLQLNRFNTVLGTNPPSAMRMVAPGKAMAVFRQEVIRDFSDGKATNTWAEVDEELAGYSEAFALLHQITNRPKLDFMLDYSQGFSLLLPHLAPTKNATQRLQAAMLSALHRGDTATALRHAHAIMALIKGLTDERLVISQLVRIADAAITFSGQWELLQAPDLTDVQLAALQHEWEEMDFIEPMEHAFMMERAMGELTVDRMRASSAEFQKLASAYGRGGTSSGGSTGNWVEDAGEAAKGFWDKTKLKTKETAWRVSWAYPDQLRKLKGDQVLIDCARMARTNGHFGLALQAQTNGLSRLGITQLELDDWITASPGTVNFRTILSQSIISLDRVMLRVRRIEVSRQFMITVIALKRYHLRHGEYPEDLKALTPELLASVPRDPVDGRPLRYRRDGKSFVLYSVGENGTDEGGDPRPSASTTQSVQWDRGADWVWPQPASDGEIEDAYKRVLAKQTGAPAPSRPSPSPVAVQTNAPNPPK